MSDLVRASIEIILQNQSPGGAYLASPNFPPYRYCWFRDGAFIAYAMDLVGQPDSAARFHDWAATNILKRAAVIERAVSKARLGQPLEAAEFLHTRYSVDGEETGEAWPNFQLDGFGTWLWSLAEHCRLHGALPGESWLSAARLVAAYISVLWTQPCYDCWEEFPDQVHPYTLAAIYGGLQAHAALSGADHSQTTHLIQAFLHQHAILDGHFVKYIGSQEVDASLLGLAVPYRLVSPDDPLMRTTVAEIVARLYSPGGVHRYARDTYYGGGEWVLLTAWLGWYYTQVGDWPSARACLDLVQAQAGPHGFLPEQVPSSLNDPSCYPYWLDRWGPIANPLLWSHAKYLILQHALSNPLA